MMQLLAFFLLTLSSSFTSAYHFDFEVSIHGPEDSGCNEPDAKKFFKGLGRKIELGGNEYLTKEHFGGIFVDVEMTTQIRRELLHEITDEKINELEALNDEELEEGIRHRVLWGHGWSSPGSGSCHLCPQDNGDGRRNLRSLLNADQILRKFEFEGWMNSKMPSFMKTLVESSGESEECKASAEQWTGTFEWKNGHN